MDKETLEAMQILNKPVDLGDLKKFINKSLKTKIIGLSALNGSAKDEVEKQINEFIKDKEIVDIKFQVIKNYLPHTASNEYEELWYVLIEYEE